MLLHLLVMHVGINSTRDVWRFCQIGLAPFANITRDYYSLIILAYTNDYLY